MRRIVTSTLVLVVGLIVIAAIVNLRERLATQPADPLTVPPARADCTVRTAAGEVTLSHEQMANAATIAAVGMVRKVPERAIVVALAAAQQESRLHNVNYGDRDSLGLFQQRPSQGWGTEEQVMDPRHAAGSFYAALLRVRGWENMRVTEAAQRVQRSAFPEAYEKWTQSSSALAEALVGRAAAAVSCTREATPAEPIAAGIGPLRDALRLDWGDAVQVRDVDESALTLAPMDEEHGWRYAHWIVAHCADTGVGMVRFGRYEWDGDGWHEIEISHDQVVAEAVSH